MRSSALSHKFARAIASGVGCGYFPRAPGTAASAAATLVAMGLASISPYLLPVAVVVACASGLWAIARLDVRDDPGWVVIDEIAGQWIALLAASPPTIPTLVGGFLFFRAFDILKPGPVHWVERAPGGLGVMADDVLAGLLAAVLLLACRAAFPALFEAFPLAR